MQIRKIGRGAATSNNRRETHWFLHCPIRSTAFPARFQVDTEPSFNARYTPGSFKIKLQH